MIYSKNQCILRFSIVSGQDESKSPKRMEGENRMVYEFIPMSRIGSNRRGAKGVRVENFPGFTTSQILAEIQKMTIEIQCELEQYF